MQSSKLELDEIKKSISSIEGVLSSLREKIEKIEKIDVSHDEKQLGLIPCLDREMTIKINDIMDNFDFHTVHSVMKFLGWKYAFLKGEYRIPSIDEIRDFAFDLLVRAATEKTDIASGGFRAVYDGPDANNPDRFIQLEFILTDYEGFAD